MTAPLEQFATGFGGKVTRRPLDEVLAELEAQEEATWEADKAARRRYVSRRNRNARKTSRRELMR